MVLCCELLDRSLKGRLDPDIEDHGAGFDRKDISLGDFSAIAGRLPNQSE